MWIAAATRKGIIASSAAALALALIPGAVARTDSSLAVRQDAVSAATSPKPLPAQLWAFELRRPWLRKLTPRFVSGMREAGVNAVVLDGRRLSSRELKRAAQVAERGGLLVLAPFSKPRAQGRASAVGAACRSYHGRHGICAIRAGSVVDARSLAAQGTADLVVVWVHSPGQVEALAATSTSSPSRVLAVATLTGSRFAPQAWTVAIDAALASDGLDLGVSPTGGKQQHAVSSYLALLGKRRSDKTPPSKPTGLAVTATTDTTVSLTWNQTTDNVGVIGYDLYRGKVRLDSTTGLTYTVTGLTCGTSYLFGVAALDAASNHSVEASVAGSTANCSTPPPPPPPLPPPPPPPPPPPGTADLYIAPSGSDSSPCTQTAPCKTFNRAYSVAQLGQTVEVAGGTYPGETMRAAPKTGGTGVVSFRPAAGASATMSGDLTVRGPNHIQVSDMTMGGYYISGGTTDFTSRNVTLTTLFVRWASYVSIIGGSVGGTCDGTSETVGNDPDSQRTTHVLIDGVLFHDITRACNTSSHIECLFVQGASYVTIRNSKFRDCDVMDMFFHSINGATPPDNVVIENNWFDDPGGYSIMFRSDTGQVLTNYTLRYNSFLSSFFAEGPGTWTNFDVVGNISPMNPWACVTGITYSHNVFSNTTCGPSDLQAAPGFVNPGGFDLHLAPGSAAIDTGDPAQYPHKDIDGRSRPMGSAPDAGAHEAG
jgi:hypothetical protein